MLLKLSLIKNKINTKPCCLRTSSSCCDKCHGRLASQLTHNHATYRNSTAFKAALWKKPDLAVGEKPLRFALLNKNLQIIN